MYGEKPTPTSYIFRKIYFQCLLNIHFFYIVYNLLNFQTVLYHEIFFQDGIFLYLIIFWLIIRELFIIVREREEIFCWNSRQTRREIAALMIKIQNGHNTKCSSMFYTLLQPFHRSDLLTERRLVKCEN
jgi:hypothetical protein